MAKKVHQASSEKPHQTYNSVHVTLIVLVLVLGFMTLYVNRDMLPFKQLFTPKTAQKQSMPSVKTPEGPLKIAKGKGEYSVSVSSDWKGPRPEKLSLSEQDPSNGETQDVTLSYRFAGGVKSVEVTIHTDNGSKTHAMEQISTNGDVSGWKGSWTIEDKYLTTYNFVFTAVGQDGSTSAYTFTLR